MASGSYRTQMGMSLSLFHPVRDVNGVFVAGQAASLAKDLLGPDRLAAPTELAAVSLSDYATGWVRATAALFRLGEYTLSLTNPVGTDGRTEEYSIVVSAGVSGGANLLTSLDRVRTRLQLTAGGDNHPIQPGEPHPFDDLINLLISEVSDEYERNLGRQFAEATYTLYLDGTGRPSLVLPVGPLVSVTSLESVLYGDDGAGGVTESRTTIPRFSYVLSGLRASPRFNGLGRIDLSDPYCGYFTKGAKNYRCICVAGFDVLPESIVGLATEDVVFRLMTRDTAHLLSRSLGDGSISYLRPAQMREERDQRLSAFLLDAA
jgi:hypothetical protein